MASSASTCSPPKDTVTEIEIVIESPEGNTEQEQGEVLICSGNNSFRQKSSLMRTKTKSRLLDPPERGAGNAQSGDDDDPFLEENVPEDYKRWKFSVASIIQLLSLIVLVAALVSTRDEHITSENQAKVAAKKIFFNVAKPGSEYIHLEDLMRFMREDEAQKTVRLLEDGIEQDGISKRALKNWVVNAFGERRALALSLNDTKTAIDKLHHMLNALVGVLIIVIWLLILRVATTHFLIFLTSQLLLVVFVFGNTFKTTFEAIVFLFVMHPFDVGDRVEVDGVQMVVEEMNILTTVFLKFDNRKIYYPNSVLSTKPIHNFYRSPDMEDAIDFSIHISTPGEKIAAMKEMITSYVDNRSDHWYPAPMIVMRDMVDMNRLKFSTWLTHRMNFKDKDERWTRRSHLVEEMVKIFRELDIEYRLLPLDVNVRNLPPISSSRVPSNWNAHTG